jgi:hypothetical protein
VLGGIGAAPRSRLAYFRVRLYNAKGVTYDNKNTSSFSLSGCPASGTNLGSYPIPN